MKNFKDGDFTVTTQAEEAVVGKQSRVVEEVDVGKEMTERTESVRDTVKRTDVEVDEINTRRCGKTQKRLNEQGEGTGKARKFSSFPVQARVCP